jgi:glycosyltransferase involved in cell wall biosynthesis
LYRSRPLWTLDSIVNLPSATRELKSFVGDFRPDVIVHTDVGLAFIALPIIKEHVANVFHLYNVPDGMVSSFMGKRVMRRCSGCLAASNFIAAQFSPIYPEINVHTVYNAIEIPKEANRTAGTKVRIGIVGQLLPRKRHHVLLEAVALLEERLRHKIEIRIYGDDTTKYALEVRRLVDTRALQSVVRWMGFVASRQKIYTDLDILVAPAVDEPFGTTVLEASAYSLAVVASRSGGFPEMVIHGRTGLLVSPDNPSELAGSIKVLIEDPRLREQLGENSQVHMANAFSTDKPASSFISAMHKFGITERALTCVENWAAGDKQVGVGSGAGAVRN